MSTASKNNVKNAMPFGCIIQTVARGPTGRIRQDLAESDHEISTGRVSAKDLCVNKDEPSIGSHEQIH